MTKGDYLMKKYSILLLILLIAMPVEAQHKTSIRQRRELQPPPASTPLPTPVQSPDNDSWPENAKWNDPGEVAKIRSDVFIAPVGKFTQINDAFAFLGGVRAGWIINQRYVIGLGGYGLVNDVPGPTIDTAITPDLAIKYGGVELEYIIRPEDMVHFSVATLVALGYVRYDYTDSTRNDDDTFWVLEPTVNVYVNMTKYLRTGLGLGYRFAGDVNLGKDVKDVDLSGFAVTLSLNFGTYGATLIQN
jgi:hypothetical protein